MLMGVGICDDLTFGVVPGLLAWFRWIGIVISTFEPSWCVRVILMEVNSIMDGVKLELFDIHLINIT